MEMSCEGKIYKYATTTSVKHEFMLSQKSGWVIAIFQWSEPGAMVTWRADFAIALLWSHHIHETLMLVLLSWIDHDQEKSWNLHEWMYSSRNPQEFFYLLIFITIEYIS